MTESHERSHCITHKSKNRLLRFVDGKLKLKEYKIIKLFRDFCLVMVGYLRLIGLETNGFVAMMWVLDVGAVLLQTGWFAESPWAACLVRLQLKQRTTSSLHLTPMLMSCDRHSACWGQVTPCLQAHSLWVCVCICGINGVMLSSSWWQATLMNTNTPKFHSVGDLVVIKLLLQSCQRDYNRFDPFDRHRQIVQCPKLSHGSTTVSVEALSQHWVSVSVWCKPKTQYLIWEKILTIWYKQTNAIANICTVKVQTSNKSHDNYSSYLPSLHQLGFGDFMS